MRSKGRRATEAIKAAKLTTFLASFTSLESINTSIKTISGLCNRPSRRPQAPTRPCKRATLCLDRRRRGDPAATVSLDRWLVPVRLMPAMTDKNFNRRNDRFLSSSVKHLK